MPGPPDCCPKRDIAGVSLLPSTQIRAEALIGEYDCSILKKCDGGAMDISSSVVLVVIGVAVVWTTMTYNNLVALAACRT